MNHKSETKKKSRLKYEQKINCHLIGRHLKMFSNFSHQTLVDGLKRFSLILLLSIRQNEPKRATKLLT